jgi:hypothetical protein
MPPTRQIEHGWADLNNGTAALQGFLGWRIEMTAVCEVTNRIYWDLSVKISSGRQI